MTVCFSFSCFSCYFQGVHFLIFICNYLYIRYLYRFKKECIRNQPLLKLHDIGITYRYKTNATAATTYEVIAAVIVYRCVLPPAIGRIPALQLDTQVLPLLNGY